MIKAHLNSIQLIIVNGGLSIRSRDLSETSRDDLKSLCIVESLDFDKELARLKRLFLFRGGDDINTFSTGEKWEVEDVKDCLYGMRETGIISRKITTFAMPDGDSVNNF